MQKRASSATHHQVFPPPGWRKHRQQQETQNAHSALKMEQTLQDNHMFTCVQSAQKEGWQSVKKAIVTHTNFFSAQQEQKGITSPSNQIIVTTHTCLIDTN